MKEFNVKSLSSLKSLSLLFVCLSVFFRMISFGSEIKLEPRPDWSPLGI